MTWSECVFELCDILLIGWELLVTFVAGDVAGEDVDDGARLTRLKAVMADSVQRATLLLDLHIVTSVCSPMLPTRRQKWNARNASQMAKNDILLVFYLY